MQRIDKAIGEKFFFLVYNRGKVGKKNYLSKKLILIIARILLNKEIFFNKY